MHWFQEAQSHWFKSLAQVLRYLLSWFGPGVLHFQGPDSPISLFSEGECSLFSAGVESRIGGTGYSAYTGFRRSCVHFTVSEEGPILLTEVLKHACLPSASQGLAPGFMSLPATAVSACSL